MFFSRILQVSALVIGILMYTEPCNAQGFESTIPVVDMNDFYNLETRHLFIEQMTKALHEVGFFAVINPHIDVKALNLAYDASKEFFNTSQNLKQEIFVPSLNGQRGYVPGETAQGFQSKDFKEFLHIGRKNNLWPSWMDLKNPMEKLISSLDEHSYTLQRAMAIAIGQTEDYFVEMTTHGECLLRPLHYPATTDPNTLWAAQHTDIDLFTILPMSTEEGLQVFHQEKWIDVKVPEDAFIVNCGDKLQNLTNGYFKSSLHRVVAKPGKERYSIVYFVHPRDDDVMDPIASCIDLTGGVCRYPKASSLELLASRLRELGLASPELLQLEKNSGLLDRIQILVEEGVASEPVQKTYSIWQKDLQK